jgi:hypothetical protein
MDVEVRFILREVTSSVSVHDIYVLRFVAIGVESLSRYRKITLNLRRAVEEKSTQK